ncbi:site-specific integrase [Sinomicrobium kalidii]|uniref:site-specific integrase n=1 Tax=Sinomicrobium kalidii TaxID=2900738 RepID=UPI001E2C40A6|nr:site-specific integrase [Sinomicrobium kalidii]UGU17711.1 site-specific integrase [Sinomicrobium kalidii]
MPTLTFDYRSVKGKAYLQARLLYHIEDNDKRYSIYAPTKIHVSKSFWSEYRTGKQFRDVEKSNLKKDIDGQTQDLRFHVLNEFDNTPSDTIDKEWFTKTVCEYYNPPQPKATEIIPHSLLGYWDFYINLRKHELTTASLKKWNVIKHKLGRFQKAEGRIFEIKDVNENFTKLFVEYCKSENYSQNTISKEIRFIKTVCRHARMKGVEVSPEIDALKVKNEKVTKIYLSFDELKKLRELDDLPDYLDNARDWLIISCYTGQRVSDFMRFTPDMIREVKSAVLLDVTQVKTGKTVSIPVLPEVTEILDKRDGDFPRPISDQRYNEYIKEVCKRAKINKKIKGRLATNLNKDNKGETKMRNVIGEYPKWKLVTSHIGRRSFATNYYGKISTSYLKNITGHGTEQMLLAYIGKSSKDTALEAYELLLNAKQ